MSAPLRPSVADVASAAGEPARREEAEELLAFARGEEPAVRAVFARHGAAIARVVSRFGATEAEVEDIVQTTFVSAMKAAGGFRGQSSVRTWLVSIALNHTRMVVRGAARERRHLTLFAADPPAAVSAPDALERHQDVVRLHRALEALSPVQREALVLCELEGIPGKDVAVLLDAPVATIWRRVHDAKVSLRKLLAEGKPR